VGGGVTRKNVGGSSSFEDPGGPSRTHPRGVLGDRKIGSKDDSHKQMIVKSDKQSNNSDNENCKRAEILIPAAPMAASLRADRFQPLGAGLRFKHEGSNSVVANFVHHLI